MVRSRPHHGENRSLFPRMAPPLVSTVARTRGDVRTHDPGRGDGILLRCLWVTASHGGECRGLHRRRADRPRIDEEASGGVRLRGA